MAAAAITVGSATLYYGQVADLATLSGTKGDIFWADDTNTEYTCDADGTNWTITRLNNTAGAAAVYLQTLLAGEDQTNDVMKVEAQFEYQTVLASATADILGTAGTVGDSGSVGDYLHSIIVTTSTGTVTVIDNVTTVAVIPANSTGVWPINAVSSSGAWNITTATSTTCTAIGRFT